MEKEKKSKKKKKKDKRDKKDKKSKKRKSKDSEEEEEEDEPFGLLVLPPPTKRPLTVEPATPVEKNDQPPVDIQTVPTIPVIIPQQEPAVPKKMPPLPQEKIKGKAKMVIVDDSDDEDDELIVLRLSPPLEKTMVMDLPSSKTEKPKLKEPPKKTQPSPVVSPRRIEIPVSNNPIILSANERKKIDQVDKLFRLVAREDICFYIPDLCNVIHRLLSKDIGLQQPLLLIEMQNIILTEIQNTDDAKNSYTKFVKSVPDNYLPYLKAAIDKTKNLVYSRKQAAKEWISDIMIVDLDSDNDEEESMNIQFGDGDATVDIITGKLMHLDISRLDRPDVGSNTSDLYAIDVLNINENLKDSNKRFVSKKDIPIRICNDVEIKSSNILNLANTIMDLTVEKNMPIFRKYLEQELFKSTVEELCGIAGDILNLILLIALKNPKKIDSSLKPLIGTIQKLLAYLPKSLPLNVYRSLTSRGAIKSPMDNKLALDLLKMTDLDVVNEARVYEISSKINGNIRSSLRKGERNIIDMLYQYQLETVKWMCERELYSKIYPSQSDTDNCGVKGGIINLLPGMGKTRISLIQIMLATHPRLNLNQSFGSKIPTLIITPLNILFDWRTEVNKIKDFANENNLKYEAGIKIFFWHASADGILYSEEEIKKFDIIITTYSTIMSSFKQNYTKIDTDIIDINKISQDQIFTSYPQSKTKYRRIQLQNLPNQKQGPSANLNDVMVTDDEEEEQGGEHQQSISAPKELSLLHNIKWPRIICDESHVFSNYKTTTFASVVSLLNNANEKAIRFCLTGTPFRNRREDLVSQLYFCGYRTFLDKTLEKRATYTFKAASERSECLMPNVYSLQYGPNTVKLPELREESINFQLSDLEMSIYTQYRAYATSLYTEYINPQGNQVKYATLFAAITRMRQCAIAPYLVYKDKSPLINAVLTSDIATSSTPSPATKDKDIIDVSQYEFVDNEIEQTLENIKLPHHPVSSPDIDRGDNVSKEDFRILDKVIETTYAKERSWLSNIDDAGISSTRILKVIEILTKIYHEFPDDKTVIFSNYVDALALVQLAIEKLLTLPKKSQFAQDNSSDEILSSVLDTQGSERILSKLYIGAIPQQQRANIRKQFTEDKNFKILLVSYKVGETGLNLQEANRVILLDESWTDAVDLQAQARVLRIGQKKTVYVYRLHAVGTIDDRVQDIRLSKRKEWSRLRDYRSSYQLEEEANAARNQKLDLKKIFWDPDTISGTEVEDDRMIL